MKYQEEIQALLKKAERSLRAANSMIDSQDFDFSLSRAYYAMFYFAEALLLNQGPQVLKALWSDRLFLEGIHKRRSFFRAAL